MKKVFDYIRVLNEIGSLERLEDTIYALDILERYPRDAVLRLDNVIGKYTITIENEIIFADSNYDIVRAVFDYNKMIEKYK